MRLTRKFVVRGCKKRCGFLVSGGGVRWLVAKEGTLRKDFALFITRSKKEATTPFAIRSCLTLPRKHVNWV